MSIPSQQYVTKVKAHLICKRTTKELLLSELKTELEEALQDFDSEEITYENICHRFGTPEKLAAELMESVDESEITFVKKRKKLLLGLAFAILIFALVFTYIKYKQHQILDPDKAVIRIYQTEPILVDEGELYDD